jgi:hypothetical protein
MQDADVEIGTYRVNDQPARIAEAMRFRHAYVIGMPGMGKSTLLENLAIQDIHQGQGVAFIDPHGTSAERILEHIPSWRVGDVAYIKPADHAWPIAINVVDVVEDAHRFTHVSMIVDAFRNLFGDSWGPRLQQILTGCLAALTEVPNTSVLGVVEMLANPGYRAWVVKQAKDPMTRHFWDKQFALYTKDYEREATPAVQNKLYQFLANPLIRNILGQVKSSIDFDFLLSNRRILLVNLAKQAIGQVEANLLGSLIVSLLQAAAMRQLSRPEEERVPFYGYIDEFHNFTTDAFVTLLPEVRKAKLGLTMAHQFTGQLSERVQEAVFGAVGTIVAFQVGSSEDAVLLERQFGTLNGKHMGTRRDFLSLPPYQCCVNWGDNEGTMINTYPPIGELIPAWHSGRADVVIGESRRRFGRVREKVEERIGRFLTRPVAMPTKKRPSKQMVQ